MKKHIATLIAFLLPIFRRALLDVAVDTVNDIAYKKTGRLRPPPRNFNYSRFGGYDKRQHHIQPSLGRPLAAETKAETTRELPFHDVLMVAFDISGPNATVTQQWLMDKMPKPNVGGYIKSEVELDSWWIANDERYDRSDCDSAVFVSKGKQAEARELLRENGLVD